MGVVYSKLGLSLLPLELPNPERRIDSWQRHDPRALRAAQQYLFKKYKILVSAATINSAKMGELPLIHELAKRGDVRGVIAALTLGAPVGDVAFLSINCHNQGLMSLALTPLHFAILNGNSSIVKVLLQAGLPARAEYPHQPSYLALALRLLPGSDVSTSMQRWEAQSTLYRYLMAPDRPQPSSEQTLSILKNLASFDTSFASNRDELCDIVQAYRDSCRQKALIKNSFFQQPAPVVHLFRSYGLHPECIEILRQEVMADLKTSEKEIFASLDSTHRANFPQ